MATIEKKVTLPILGYYDDKLKAWIMNQMDTIAQADWAETDPFQSGYIKNKPTDLVTASTLEFKRVDDQGNENNNLDSVSVLVNGEVIGEFYSSHETVRGDVSFIAEELVSYFEGLNITPATYDGNEWTEEVYPVADMIADNGPYLVFITQNANGEQLHHIKSMKGALANYATHADLEKLRAEIEKSNELEII